jgi:NTP pyrophosphatase (non-canonical NTP hydrolase)
MTIDELVKDSHERAKRKGWWDAQLTTLRFVGDVRRLDLEAVRGTIPEKLALVHSEVSEALECYRDGEVSAEIGLGGKPEGLPSELADIVIRVCDLAGALGIDLDTAIKAKAAFNETREIMHGGKKC